MVRSKIIAIKNWIKTMGFELISSHEINGNAIKINHYSLGNFGIYEEISKKVNAKSIKNEKLRFISWNPWGIDFEVHSVNELREAYQDSVNLNPDLV